jgi:Domain of unknown function (DUF4070)
MDASSSAWAVPRRGPAKMVHERPGQRWLTRGNARALVTSIVRQGIFGRQRWSYWKFLLTVAARYRHCVGPAMTLAVMGYHFQVMTSRLSEAVNSPKPPARSGETLLRE